MSLDLRMCGLIGCDRCYREKPAIASGSIISDTDCGNRVVNTVVGEIEAVIIFRVPVPDLADILFEVSSLEITIAVGCATYLDRLFAAKKFVVFKKVWGFKKV